MKFYIRTVGTIVIILTMALVITCEDTGLLITVKERVENPGGEGETDENQSVSAPRFNYDTGTYSNDLFLEISCDTDGAIIHYTTDGQAPTQNSPFYSSPIEISGHGTEMTIRAIALKSGIESEETSVDIIIDYFRVSTPNFDYGTDTYHNDFEVTVSSTTEGSTITYTTDGTDPFVSSTAETGQNESSQALITVDHSMTIRAYAVKDQMLDSTEGDVTYTLVVLPPAFSPEGGNFTSEQTVTISCPTNGATVRYTTDNSVPAPSNGTEGISVLVEQDLVLKAMAYKTGYNDSSVSEANYVVEAAKPEGLSAESIADRKISITWTDRAENETGYAIQRDSDVDFPSPEDLDTSLPADTVSYVDDSGLSRDSTFYYRVRAYNSVGSSGWCSPAEATTPPMGFTRHVIDTDQHAYDLYHSDIDDDGDIDIATAIIGESYTQWWENDGSEAFTLQKMVGGYFAYWGSVYVGDLDGDGDRDMVTGEVWDDVMCAWWENDGAADPSFVQHTLSVIHGDESVWIEDINGDGYPDIITAGDEKLSWWENDGQTETGFATEHVISSTSDRLLAVCDIDGDGDADVVSDSNGLCWWENNGSASFLSHPISIYGGYEIHVVDVDGMNGPDLLVHNSSYLRLYLHDGQANPSFSEHVIADGGNAFGADVDNDGDTDIVTVDYDCVAYWENDGAENFHKVLIDDTYTYPYYCSAVDLDEDGDQDLLTLGGSEPYDLSWWENDLIP